jgi:hypothetical protein
MERWIDPRGASGGSLAPVEPPGPALPLVPHSKDPRGPAPVGPALEVPEGPPTRWSQYRGRPWGRLPVGPVVSWGQGTMLSDHRRTPPRPSDDVWYPQGYTSKK